MNKRETDHTHYFDDQAHVRHSLRAFGFLRTSQVLLCNDDADMREEVYIAPHHLVMDGTERVHWDLSCCCVLSRVLVYLDGQDLSTNIFLRLRDAPGYIE